MARNSSNEPTAECPVCGDEILKRGMFMHIFQSDDPEGKNHHPRYEVPPGLDLEKIKVTGSREVEMDYPDEVELDDKHYLDTYTGKAYNGRRGLMIHLGQKSGTDNIPDDVTERHVADDFPVVEIDDDGNIVEVVKWPSDSVPPLEPYLPWFTDSNDGYVPKQKIQQFVEEIEETTGAASVDTIKEELLD